MKSEAENGRNGYVRTSEGRGKEEVPARGEEEERACQREEIAEVPYFRERKL